MKGCLPRRQNAVVANKTACRRKEAHDGDDSIGLPQAVQCRFGSDPEGRCLAERRIEHQPGAIREFLRPYSLGSPVAVETIGNWYWIVDEIEAAGMTAQLVHARKAKLMLGSINKTDRLDVRGLNKLQRTATLPTV